jgi:Putative DNA-binding domain
LADELSELVDAPAERPDVEYKAWLDLKVPKHRADLARHIAALANLGGGYLIFGIDDSGMSCGPAPAVFAVDHDVVAAITKKYLEPPLHCDVQVTASSTGVQHPVIRVPPHGATPICAKANGPEVDGKVTGIVAGAYYLRKPGPESSQIVTAADWREVIRRCALHDRTAILAAVTAALSGNSATASSIEAPKLLEIWAAAADKDYLTQIDKVEFAVPLQDCRLQLSYRIETETEEALPFQGLVNVLRQVGGEVDQHVQSGWSLFHVFATASLAPRWSSNPSAEDDEFLEASAVNLDQTLNADQTLGFDLWRVSPKGQATVIREYWEDTKDFRLQPRATLNPRIMARVLGELVRHAEAFSSRFSAPLRVQFRCEWRGLRGRRLFVPNAIPFHTAEARTDYVVTIGRWAVGALASEIPEIVANLGGKVTRALASTLSAVFSDTDPTELKC